MPFRRHYPKLCDPLLSCVCPGFGFSALSTALRFLPLGITAMGVNFIVPMLLQPVGPGKLLLASWLLCIAGLILLCRMGSADDYWRLCLPGMVLYIAGVGTVYFVGNVSVVATAEAELQGTVSGVYNVRQHYPFIHSEVCCLLTLS